MRHLTHQRGSLQVNNQSTSKSGAAIAYKSSVVRIGTAIYKQAAGIFKFR